MPVSAETAADGAAALYDRYYDRVFGYCVYQLGSREEAEDVAQTTFMWAFRGLRRGVVPRAEATWLFTIAQNACRARHRARGRRRAREVLSDPVTLADMSPAHAADADDLIGLEDALSRMPEQQRRALLLREWRGLSYKEIAAELGLSNAAVETLLFRARRSLAELLAGGAAPKRARRFAIDLGSMGAALKAFLGSGAAAKLAAGLAAAVIATAVAGSTEQSSPAVDKPSTAPVGIMRAVPASQPQADARADRGKRQRSKTETPAKLALPGPTDPTPSAPTTTLPELTSVTHEPLAAVNGLVGQTVETAEQTLAPVTGAVAPLTVELP